MGLLGVFRSMVLAALLAGGACDGAAAAEQVCQRIIWRLARRTRRSAYPYQRISSYRQAASTASAAALSTHSNTHPWHRAQVRAAVPMYILTRKIKAMGIKVVLSGEGADEALGGYLFFHKAPNAAEFHQCALGLLSRPVSLGDWCWQGGGSSACFHVVESHSTDFHDPLRRPMPPCPTNAGS